MMIFDIPRSVQSLRISSRAGWPWKYRESLRVNMIASLKYQIVYISVMITVLLLWRVSTIISKHMLKILGRGQNGKEYAIENSLPLPPPPPLPVPSSLTPPLPFPPYTAAGSTLGYGLGQNDNLRGLSRSGSDKERLGKYNHAATTPTTPGEKKREKSSHYIHCRKPN